MRKQYHFRKTPRGVLAWDVARLVELSRGLEIRRVPLSAIRELDEDYWFGFGEKPTCRAIAEHVQLVEETELDHPILLDAEGRVFDGMHRVVKALLAGDRSIPAIRFEQTPAPDHVGKGPEDLPT